jgi:hypothetical protein
LFDDRGPLLLKKTWGKMRHGRVVQALPALVGLTIVEGKRESVREPCNGGCPHH